MVDVSNEVGRHVSELLDHIPQRERCGEPKHRPLLLLVLTPQHLSRFCQQGCCNFACVVSVLTGCNSFTIHAQSKTKKPEQSQWRVNEKCVCVCEGE